MPKKANAIPDRWLDYLPVGKAIEGTRFIPFKVPLKQHLHDTNEIPEDKVFTPSELFKVLGEKKLELGLLIDLTFTRRYYDNEEITSSDVTYEKVFTAGHHIPDRSVVKRFTEVVKEFEEKNADNDLLIGVHCTHGVNRTGYLICRYMIEHLEFTPDDALKAYEKARGYPVERQNYVEDLKTRPRSDSSDDEPSAEYISDPHRKPYHQGHERRYQPYANRGKDNYRNEYYEDRYDRSYGSNQWYGNDDYGYQGYYRDSYHSSGQYWDQGRRNDDRSSYYSRNTGDYYSDTRRRGRGNASINGGRQFKDDTYNCSDNWNDQYRNNRHRGKWTKKTYY